jgi:hypothetical protein
MQMNEPDCDKVDHRLKAGIGFAGSHGDPFELFELLEEILDQMPAFVHVLAVGSRIAASFPCRDDMSLKARSHGLDQRAAEHPDIVQSGDDSILLNLDTGLPNAEASRRCRRERRCSRHRRDRLRLMNPTTKESKEAVDAILYSDALECRGASYQ